MTDLPISCHACGDMWPGGDWRCSCMAASVRIHSNISPTLPSVMSSYSSMTDNPLVEAVARAMTNKTMAGVHPSYSQRRDMATAALRAIEDAGWKVVPVEASEAEIIAGVKLAMSVSLSAQYTWPTYIRDMRATMLDAAPTPTAAPSRAD